MIQDYSIQSLTELNLQKVIEVVIRSFMTLNSIWRKYNSSDKAIYPIIRSKLLPCVNKEWSLVLQENQRVIGAVINLDLLDYLSQPIFPSNSILFSKLGKAGKELEKNIDITNLKKGEAMYGHFGVIDPKIGNKGISLKFWWYMIAISKAAGWKYYYTRMSNIVSLKMALTLRAEIVAQVAVDGEENEKLWMIRVDLQKHFPTYQMHEIIDASKNEQKRKLKPSL